MDSSNHNCARDFAAVVRSVRRMSTFPEHRIVIQFREKRQILSMRLDVDE